MDGKRTERSNAGAVKGNAQKARPGRIQEEFWPKDKSLKIAFGTEHQIKLKKEKQLDAWISERESDLDGCSV
ncbi:MAG TPA: hypothetical protein EYO33_01055 [Phycisphaerales bacterium]|nr:hypothetical protein [Phycisphaerales bacterium]